MIRRVLEMIASCEEVPNRRALRSPAVGIYRAGPRPGEGLVPGSLGGTLVILGRTVDLLVPRGVSGTVTRVLAARGEVPVAYGETLLELAASKAGDADAHRPDRATADGPGSPAGGPHIGPVSSGGADGAAAADAESGTAEAELEPDLFALRAPTAGVFYARPDPSSAPFVGIGSSLQEGQTAGLIEVMKSFSPIVHPGADLPSPARVAEIRVSEGSEVRRGQILFLLRAE